MANKTIPQLPEQTGLTDNDLLAIVDSGETTTSKIKVSTLLSGAGGKYIAADGTNNIVPDYYPTTSINSGSNESAIIAGTGNTITNSTSYSAIVGSWDCINNSDRGGIYSSYQSTVNNGTAGVVVGGQSNVTGTGGYYQGVFAGQSNTAQGIQSIVLGGQNNQTSATADKSGVLGGNGNSVTGNYSTILGGNTNTNSGLYSSVIGGRNNDNSGKDSTILSSEYAGITGNATIIGGWGSYVYSNTPNPENGAFSIYSPYTYIRQNNGSGTTSIKGDLQGLIASKACEINGQTGNEATRSLIIGSNDTNLTGGTTNTLMLGCSGRTGVNSYTTYVETLEAFTHVVLNDYSNLNFTSDANAAAGGVPLGGLYHNAGDLKVRIT